MESLERVATSIESQPPPKKLRVDCGTSSSSSSASTMGIEESNEPGVILNIDANFLNPISTPKVFRIQILEGDPFIERIQNQICDELKIKRWDSKWHLYDRQEKKFIWVTVSMNTDQISEQYEEKKSLNPGFACHVDINPDTGVIVCHDHAGGLSGFFKVSDFIIKRKRAIANLGIMETELSDSENVISSIFCNGRTYNMVAEWHDFFWSKRNTPIPYNVIPNNVERIRDTGYDVVRPGLILSKLEDPTTRDTEKISQWNGKLPPSTWLEFDLVTSEKDNDIINEWLSMNDLSTAPVAWRVLVDHWQNLEKQNTFCLISKKERANTKFESIMKDLGVGKKKTILQAGNNETSQPQYSGPERTKLSPAFAWILEDLTEDLPWEETTFFNVSQDTSTSDHPMAKLSGLLFDELFLIFSRSMLGAMASLNANFYSRLGGAYVNPEVKGSKRSNVVWFPLLVNSCDALGNKRRRVAGICTRGPQHAKFGTDKINVMILVKLSLTPWNKQQISILFKKGTCFSSPTGEYLTYQTALNKDDSSFLSFPLNSLFVVCNLFGEVILNNSNTSNFNELLNLGRAELSSCKKWYLDRMVEALLMGLLGGAQEEGTLAGLRKLYMSMVAWSRQEFVCCISPDSFCEDINECLVNRPLAQHFVKQFIISLFSFNEASKSFEYVGGPYGEDD